MLIAFLRLTRQRQTRSTRPWHVPGHAPLVKGTYKSTDGGSTWDKILDNGLLSITIDPQKNSTLYAVGFPGIVKSIDGGRTWQVNPLSGASVQRSGLALDSTNPSHLYAAAAIESDAFVQKLNSAGSALMYSTYLGGRGSDVGTAITAGVAGSISVVGITTAYDFPTVNPMQPALAGPFENLFVATIQDDAGP
jgi:photosystem II stability/assembly factor-like uncharacterized protein